VGQNKLAVGAPPSAKMHSRLLRLKDAGASRPSLSQQHHNAQVMMLEQSIDEVVRRSGRNIQVASRIEKR